VRSAARASRGIELVVFDFDGVLVDTSAGHRRAWDDLWRLVGVAGPRYETIAGRRTLDVVRERTAALSPSPERIAEWVAFKQARARLHAAAGDVVFPDARGVVHELARDGFTLAIGTGASRRAVETALERLALGELFAAVVAAEDVAAGKPAPDVYRRVLERVRTRAERALVIEDSAAGLAAALGAGAWAAAVRSGAAVEHPRFLGGFEDLVRLRAALLPSAAPAGRSGGGE